MNKKQTGNITDFASDRYFILNETNFSYIDITEDFGIEIPDVEIQSVALISELNNWYGLAQVFTEVEPNVEYTFNLELTEEQLASVDYYHRFKFMVNSSEYLGYDSEGVTIVDPNNWIEQDLDQGDGTNFGISFADESMPRAIFFTMEFAGGKDINTGWTLRIDATEPSPVIPYASTPTFQKVDNKLVLSSSTDNATIYYTTDSSTPTKSSTLYTGPITMTKNCTVKAIAVADGYKDSEPAEYVVDWFDDSQPTKKSWIFTDGLSDETIANLNADATHWAENGKDADGNVNNWKNVGKPSPDTDLMANGEVIAELKDLKFDIGSNKDNSIHIAATGRYAFRWARWR